MRLRHSGTDPTTPASFAAILLMINKAGNKGNQ